MVCCGSVHQASSHDGGDTRFSVVLEQLYASADYIKPADGLYTAADDLEYCGSIPTGLRRTDVGAGALYFPGTYYFLLWFQIFCGRDHGWFGEGMSMLRIVNAAAGKPTAISRFTVVQIENVRFTKK